MRVIHDRYFGAAGRRVAKVSIATGNRWGRCP